MPTWRNPDCVARAVLGGLSAGYPSVPDPREPWLLRMSRTSSCIQAKWGITAAAFRIFLEGELSALRPFRGFGVAGVSQDQSAPVAQDWLTRCRDWLFQGQAQGDFKRVGSFSSLGNANGCRCSQVQTVCAGQGRRAKNLKQVNAEGGLVLGASCWDTRHLPNARPNLHKVHNPPESCFVVQNK